MNNQEPQNSFSLNEKISNVILLFLLLLRLVDENLPTWIFGTSIPKWFPYWYVGIAYILGVIIVLLNRHRLPRLNIDRPFVIALILGGLLYVFYLTTDIGILVGLTAGFVYWVYQSNLLYLKNTMQYPPGTLLLILSSVLLALSPVFFYSLAIKTTPNVQFFVTTFVTVLRAQLALIAFEEILFRGALWAWLRDLGLKERTAFFLPAFLFWVSHHKYLLLENTYSFWVSVPLAALLYGFLAWRSKSLTPSMIGHFLFNFTGVLIQKLL